MDVFSHPETDLRNVKKKKKDFVYFGAYGWKNLELKIFFFHLASVVKVTEDFLLTWLQAAVEVEDDHNETSQAQGKNHPSDFRLPHPQSLETTEQPGRVLGPGFMRSGRCSRRAAAGVYFITDRSIDPAR